MMNPPLLKQADVFLLLRLVSFCTNTDLCFGYCFAEDGTCFKGPLHWWLLFTFLSNFVSLPSEGAGNESVLKVLGAMLMSGFAKYWIYVCGGMFITVSFAGKLVGYKIIYMLLLLLFLCLYQVGAGLQVIVFGVVSPYAKRRFNRSSDTLI